MTKAATLVDTFATASSARWSGYGANPSINTHRLSITPTGSYPGIYSATTYDLTSSYVMIELVQPPNIGNGSISTYMNAQVSSGNQEEIGWDNGQLVLREKAAGVDSDVTIAYSPTDHRWLRIREVSGTIYWETSADSLNWTTRRSKVSGIGALTAVTINLYAGFWGTEPSPGYVLFDNCNMQVPPPTLSEGWVLGGLLFGARDGGTDISRNYFDTADWLWQTVPAAPVLHANSATWTGYLSEGGSQHNAALYDYGVTIVPAAAINESTPRYDVVFSNVPGWGADPFAGYTVPIPTGTTIPPGSDGHLVSIDRDNNIVFGLWQAAYDNDTDTWSASWGGLAPLRANGIDTNGTATATGLSRLAGVVGTAEFAAAISANTGLSHALFITSNITSASFVFPAVKSDGTNTGGVATPIPQGTRLYLDPSVDIDTISGISDGEKVIAKTLQTYGAYVGDKSDNVGAAVLGVVFEYAGGTSPGAPYVAAGLMWDYYDMTHIPWASLRFLNTWDGS